MLLKKKHIIYKLVIHMPLLSNNQKIDYLGRNKMLIVCVDKFRPRLPAMPAEVYENRFSIIHVHYYFLK